MTRTLGGRVKGRAALPTAQPTKNSAVAALPIGLVLFDETFDQADSTDIGPLLEWSTWNSATTGLQVIPETVADQFRGVLDEGSPPDVSGTFDFTWLAWSKTQLVKREQENNAWFFSVAADVGTDSSAALEQYAGVGIAYPETAEYLGGIAVGNPPSESQAYLGAIALGARIHNDTTNGWQIDPIIESSIGGASSIDIDDPGSDTHRLEVQFIEPYQRIYYDGVLVYQSIDLHDYVNFNFRDTIKQGGHYAAVFGGGIAPNPLSVAPWDPTVALLPWIDNVHTIGSGPL